MPLWATLILVLIVVGFSAVAWRIGRASEGAARSVERAFGIGLITVILGYSGWILRATIAGRVSDAALFWATLIAHGLVVVGVSMLFVGVWRFYRPRSAWAAAGAIVGSVVVLTGWALQAAAGRVMEFDAPALAPMLFVLGQVAVCSWWGSESLAYHRRMAKRLSLGLTEPVVVDRFRVMAHAAFSIALVLTLVGSSPWLFAKPPRDVPLVITAVAITTSYAALCLYCALLSPAFYQRHVLARFDRALG